MSRILAVLNFLSAQLILIALNLMAHAGAEFVMKSPESVKFLIILRRQFAGLAQASVILQNTAQVIL